MKRPSRRKWFGDVTISISPICVLYIFTRVTATGSIAQQGMIKQFPNRKRPIVCPLK